MAKNKPKPFKKTNHKQSYIAIDFEKIHLVMDYRIKFGYSAYECSFLLGKNDFFFRDAENPLKTKRYNPVDTNYLQLIFNESLSTFLPPIVEEDTYHFQVTTFVDERRRPVYEIEIKDGDGVFKHFKTIIEEDKDLEPPTPLNLVSFDGVKDFVDTLLVSGFFNDPKTALDILRRFRKHFGEDFHARNMIRVINHYTNKKSGVPLLDKSKTNEFGRRMFFKPNKLTKCINEEVTTLCAVGLTDDEVDSTGQPTIPSPDDAQPENKRYWDEP